MLDSIRVRLTLWYTLVLALVLVFLAVSTYLLYGRSLAQRTDSGIVELSSAFATTSCDGWWFSSATKPRPQEGSSTGAATVL